MKKKYATPEFDFIEIRLGDVLAYSEDEDRLKNETTPVETEDPWLTGGMTP